MIEFDEAWNQKHDPQRQTPAGFCQRCGGEIFELDTLEAYDGMCPACWWAWNSEEYDGENSGCLGRASNDRPYGGTDSSTPRAAGVRGPYDAQNDNGGDGD